MLKTVQNSSLNTDLVLLAVTSQLTLLDLVLFKHKTSLLLKSRLMRVLVSTCLAWQVSSA